MSTNKYILRSASLISFATFCSRLLGFLRDLVIARLFGVYIYAQVFVVAFRIPNLLRDLLGEGAANAAFVPVFSEYKVKHSREEFWKLANIVLNLLLVILTAVVLLGIMFSPVIVRLIAPGFTADPHKLEITIKLTRLTFPYILLVSLAAYVMGLLNSLNHFTVPAFASCLLNISIIVFALLFGESINGLAAGILVGGVLQLLVQIPIFYQKGFRPRLFKRFRHPAARTIGILMLPRLLSSCVYQLNNFVDSIFGSLAFIVGEGGVAILYFAYRLIQFPLGIFSNALSQAILPTFSTQALENSYDNLRKTLSFGLRAIFFALLPASVGFMVLSKSIIINLFGGGRFDVYSVNMTANTLFFYSIGLFAYGATKIMQSCFFALKDTVTPAKVASVALIVNIILNSILMFPLKISGLALATSLSGINTFFILCVILKRKLGDFDTARIINSFMRILVASLCMGLVCYFVSKNIIVVGIGIIDRIISLAVPIILGVLSYIIFCFIFQVAEMQESWKWLMQRRKV